MIFAQFNEFIDQLSKRDSVGDPLHDKPTSYHSTTKLRTTDRIFELTLILISQEIMTFANLMTVYRYLKELYCFGDGQFKVFGQIVELERFRFPIFAQYLFICSIFIIWPRNVININRGNLLRFLPDR